LYHILDHKTGYYENAKNVKKNVSIQPDDKSSQIITEKCEEHYYHPDDKKPYAENPVSFTKMITSMLLSSQMITSGLLSIPEGNNNIIQPDGNVKVIIQPKDNEYPATYMVTSRLCCIQPNGNVKIIIQPVI
jgi:hypothetical protein